MEKWKMEIERTFDPRFDPPRLRIDRELVVTAEVSALTRSDAGPLRRTIGARARTFPEVRARSKSEKSARAGAVASANERRVAPAS